jgi:hypothetical protein
MTKNNNRDLKIFIKGFILKKNDFLLVHQLVQVVEVLQEQTLRFYPYPIWLDIQYLYQE